MVKPLSKEAVQFLNDIVRPWDQLSELLTIRSLLEPENSEPIRQAKNIAIAIRHYPEVFGASWKSYPHAPEEISILVDVADTAKHRELNNQSRHATLQASSDFEINEEGKFRFIKNSINIRHAFKGDHDFLVTARSAIKFLLSAQGILTSWPGVLREAPNEFYPTAFLYFDPRLNISADKTTFRTFRRTEEDNLELFDPTTVIHFEVYELPDANSAVRRNDRGEL